MKSNRRDTRLTSLVASVMVTIILVASLTSAQQMMTFNKGEVFILMELGALVKAQNNQLAVARLLPAPPGSSATKDSRSPKLAVGDVISLVAGQPFTKIDEIENFYDTLAVGKEVKMLVKRGAESMVVSFTKADPKNAPMKMMVAGGPGGPAKHGLEQAFKLDGEPALIPEIGLVCSGKDGKVTVAAMMPLPSGKSPFATAPAAGDLVVSLQGKPIKSAKDLTDTWASVPEGKPVTIVIKSGGKDVTSTFPKPAAGGPVKIMSK